MQLTIIFLKAMSIVLLSITAPIVFAVVIERNFFSYYKLPLKTMSGLHSSRAGDFMILQCPYRKTTRIPSLKDMQLCTVVSRLKQPVQRNPQAGHTLHTKVDYKLRHVMKGLNGAGVKPTLLHCHREKLHGKPRHTTYWHVRAMQFPRPLSRPYFETTARSMAYQQKHQETRNENMETAATTEDNLLGNQAQTDDTHSPLRFLSSKNAIRQLFKMKTPSQFDMPNAHAKAEKFFSENLEYKKGDQMKGYQNVYHRDEIFKDHILYDDLDERGHYNVRHRNTSAELQTA